MGSGDQLVCRNDARLELPADHKARLLYTLMELGSIDAEVMTEEQVEQTSPRTNTGRSMIDGGRFVFGCAMLGFGVVCLTHGDFLMSLQPVPARMPGYFALSVLNGLILSSAGLAIAADRGARVASQAIAILVLSSIVLLQVPSAFTQPALLRSPWWVRRRTPWVHDRGRPGAIQVADLQLFRGVVSSWPHRCSPLVSQGALREGR